MKSKFCHQNERGFEWIFFATQSEYRLIKGNQLELSCPPSCAFVGLLSHLQTQGIQADSNSESKSYFFAEWNSNVSSK